MATKETSLLLNVCQPCIVFARHGQYRESSTFVRSPVVLDVKYIKLSVYSLAHLFKEV